MTTRVNPGGIFATTSLQAEPPQADKQRINQNNRNQTNNQYFNPRPQQHQNINQPFYQSQLNTQSMNKASHPQIQGFQRHQKINPNLKGIQGKFNYNNNLQQRNPQINFPPPITTSTVQNIQQRNFILPNNRYQRQQQNLYQNPGQKPYTNQVPTNKKGRNFPNKFQNDNRQNFSKQKQQPYSNQRRMNKQNYGQPSSGNQKANNKNKSQYQRRKQKQITTNKKQEARSEEQQQYNQQQQQYDQQGSEIDNEEYSHESQIQDQQEYSAQDDFQGQQQQEYVEDDQQRQQDQEQEYLQQQQQQKSQSEKQKQIVSTKKQKIKQLPTKTLPILNMKSSNLDDDVQLERCETMCPKEEFNDRKNIFKQNNRGQNIKLDNQHSFSFYEISRKTKQPSENLTLKRFKRSVITENDQVQQKQLVRTPKALIATMQYVLKNIVDSDNTEIEKHLFIDPVETQNITFVDIHQFLWNRLRAVIRDISQLSTKQQRSKQIIVLSEYITRFFILSINERRRFQMFDEKMNMQNLQKIITPLLQSYKHNKMELKRLLNQMASKKNFSQEKLRLEIQKRAIYISPYQPQITSYALVISNQRNNGRLEQIYEMFKQCDINPLLQSQAIQNAFEMRYCISSHNFSKYFELIQQQNISLLLSSSLLFHITSIRKSAVNTIMKCWKQKNDDTLLSLNLLNEHLGFKGNQIELKKFIKYIGVKLNMDQTAILKKQLGRQQQIIYNVPNYEFTHNKKDRKYYKNPHKIKNTYNQDEITREQLLKGVGIDHKNYDKQVIRTLKNHYWMQRSQQIIQKPENIMSQAQQIQKQSIQQQISQQIKQQQHKILQKKPDEKDQQIKILQLKIKKKKFLEKLQKKIQKMYRNCLARTIKKKQLINKMFLIIQNKLRNNKITIFRQILYYEQAKTILTYYFNKFRSIAYKQKQFKSHLKATSNEFTSFQYIRLKPDQQKSLNAMYRLQYQLNKDNFYNYLIQIFCRIPEEILNNLHQYQFNITILFHQQQLKDKKSVTYFQQIINFLSNNKSNSFFPQFISSKQNIKSFNSIIKFNTSKGFLKNISYQIKLIKISNQQKYKQIIRNQLYGTDLLILPQISQSIWLVKQLNSLVRNSSFRMSQIHIMLIKGFTQNQDRTLVSYLQKHPLPKDFTNIYLSQASLSKGLLCLQTKFKLKLAIQQILKSKPFFPPLQIVSIINIIAIIKKNLQFLKGIKKESKKKILYYQQYLNQCFEQIWQFQRMIFDKRQLISEWKSIIGMLVQYQQNVQQVVESNQSHQNLINGLFEKLILDFINQNFFKSINKKDYLSNLFINYINNFKDDDQVDYGFLSRIMQNIRGNILINDLITIDDNIQKIFLILLDQLIITFQQCQIKVILPINFRFLIEEQEFHERVNIKYLKTIDNIRMKKIQKLNTFQLKPKARKRKLNEEAKDAKGIEIDIKFWHQDIFDQISKRRKIQKIDTI